jgi:hypothetical protein
MLVDQLCPRDNAVTRQAPSVYRENTAKPAANGSQQANSAFSAGECGPNLFIEIPILAERNVCFPWYSNLAADDGARSGVASTDLQVCEIAPLHRFAGSLLS